MKKVLISVLLILSLSSCFPSIGLISRAIQGNDTNWKTTLEVFQEAVHTLNFDSVNETLFAPFYTPLQLENLKKSLSTLSPESVVIKSAAKNIVFTVTRTNQPNDSSAVGVYMNYTIKNLPREIALIVAKDQSGVWKIIPNRAVQNVYGGTVFALLGIRPDSADVFDLLDTVHKEIGLPYQ